MKDPLSQFLQRLRQRPVIPAIRESRNLSLALERGAGVIFVLGEDVFALEESTRAVREKKGCLFAHIDLIKGVAKDEAGIRSLAQGLGINGVLTTRSNLIGPAKKEGLIAVQRFFVLDSESLQTGLISVEKARPDAVEILPGVIFPKIAERLKKRSLPPVIAGGLITKEVEVEEILSLGAVGVSTSCQKLWGYMAKGIRP